MEKITDEMWQKAVEHTQQMKEEATRIGWNGMFYVMGCNELLERYENGERTEKLYNEMMDLH